MLYQDKFNQLIPKAIEAIKKVGIANSKDIIAKEYEGYINSFGPNIYQSGLLPTLLFFKNDSGKKQKSSKWLDAIMYVITDGKKDKDLISYVIEETRIRNKNEYKLSDLDRTRLDHFEKKITNAVVALKMALRTYEIEKSEEDKDKKDGKDEN